MMICSAREVEECTRFTMIITIIIIILIMMLMMIMAMMVIMMIMTMMMIIIIMIRQEATMTMFAGHVIVAIFAEAESPLLGLR